MLNNAGGGIYLPGNGSNRVDFKATTVAGNVADAGAGFALDGDGRRRGGGTLANSTVAGNTDVGRGRAGVRHSSASARRARPSAPAAAT